MVNRYIGITLFSPKWMIKIENSKSEDLSSGLAYTMADKLKKKCSRNDMLSKAEQRTKIGLLTLKEGQHPEDIVTSIGAV